MTAGKYCNRDVVITELDTTLIEAAKLMRQYHVGDLVVVRKKAGETIPVGIVTDRDLVIEVLAQEVPLNSITFQDIMQSDLVSVNEDETLLDTLALMRTYGVRRIVVTNRKGGLEGILTADDAIELIAEAINHLSILVRNEIKNEHKERSTS